MASASSSRNGPRRVWIGSVAAQPEPHPVYPSAGRYVPRLHRDAMPRAGHLTGRIEHVTSGESTDFAARIMAALLALAATLAQAQMPAPRFDPARGQTAEKLAADLTECGSWSEQQTGYSPQAEAAAGERDGQPLGEPLPPGPDWSASDRARAHVAQFARLRAERLAVYLRGTVACVKARGYG